jgi:hypothetical protein
MSWDEAKPLLVKYLTERELKSSSAKSKSFEKWQRADYNSTKVYVEYANFHTHLAKGVNWLARARCSGIWTAKKAVDSDLVARDIQGRCPKCMQEIAAPEMEHIVLMCTAYALQRNILQPVLEAIPEMENLAQTLQVILGGKGKTAGGVHFSLGAQWSGEAVQGLGDGSVPGFVPIAKFLGIVCPMQMGALWAWRIEPVVQATGSRNLIPN